MSDNSSSPAGDTPTDDTGAVADSGVVAEVSQPAPEVIGVRRGSFGAADSNDVTGFGGLVDPIVRPGPTERPYGGGFDQLADELELSLAARGLPASEAIERVVVEHGQITFHVPREHLLAVATALRDEPGLRFEQLCGVVGVHYPNESGSELHCIYPFLSITHNRRIALEVTCPDDDSKIPSLVPIYPTNDWHEREVWDMFGIDFPGHPALTRILMPDDWVGHPQRKDYPLGGIGIEFKGATTPPPNERRSYN